MKNLLIDVGNTYLKYHLYESDKLIDKGSMSSAKADAVVEWISTQDADAVYVASVRHKDLMDTLKLHPRITVVESTATLLGVSNAYATPNILGIDRWLAAVEAYHCASGTACAVFDLGTAITMDVVDASGQHLGGYIVPGLSLMRESLLKNTAKVRYKQGKERGQGYGINTAEAVEHGCYAMVMAWINQELCQFLERFEDGKVYFTGGLAPYVMQDVTATAILDEDLVIKALRRIALS